MEKAFIYVTEYTWTCPCCGEVNAAETTSSPARCSHCDEVVELEEN